MKTLLQKETWTILLLLLLTTAFFSPIVFKAVFLAVNTDYSAHLRFAQEMWTQRRLVIPHFIFQAEILLWQKLFGLGSQDKLSGFLASLMNLGLTASVVFFYIRRHLDKKVPCRYLACLFLTLSLLFVTPIPALYGWDGLTYLGYIGLTVYHNPTMGILKPLAVLLFWLASDSIFLKTNDKPRQATLCLALLTVLCTLAKPSYTIALLPGLLCFAAIRKLQGARLNALPALFGIIIPSILVLAWQHISYYQENHISIIFAPFAAKYFHSKDLFLKLILSILFPLLTYLAYFSQAKRDVRLNFAWIVFFFGALLAYFFGEAERLGHGNFEWSAQAGLFILFLQSALFLTNEWLGQELHRPFASRGVWCGLAYCAHLFAGIFYYFHILLYSPAGKFLYI